jgi:hypothetical protein
MTTTPVTTTSQVTQVGFNGGPLGTTSGFTHILYSLAAPIKLTKIATLTPYIAMESVVGCTATTLTPPLTTKSSAA